MQIRWIYTIIGLSSLVLFPGCGSSGGSKGHDVSIRDTVPNDTFRDVSTIDTFGRDVPIRDTVPNDTFRDASTIDTFGHDVSIRDTVPNDTFRDVSTIDTFGRDVSIRDQGPAGSDIFDETAGVDACLLQCMGKQCGDDGCGGSCGTCGKGTVCFNASCCTPKTCADLGKECGPGYDAGCGKTVDCGGCKGGKICNKGRCVATPAGFVRIPSGCFDMGAPATEAGRYGVEVPVHHVCISRSFLMSSTGVTQGQWKSLMGNNPSYFGSCGDDCPVESVSWWDAIAYSNALSKKEGLEKCYTLTGCSGTTGKDYACSKVVFKGLGCKGYRLPTEAEREYAARAGTTTSTYNGDLDASHLVCEEPNPVLDSIAWFCGNSGKNTHVVGKKAPNAWGLYDMLGNVWEWCWDRYKGDYYKESPSTDPLGPDTGSFRVLRGGSWSGSARRCRSADRGSYSPGDRDNDLGFRLCRSL